MLHNRVRLRRLSLIASEVKLTSKTDCMRAYQRLFVTVASSVLTMQPTQLLIVSSYWCFSKKVLFTSLFVQMRQEWWVINSTMLSERLTQDILLGLQYPWHWYCSPMETSFNSFFFCAASQESCLWAWAQWACCSPKSVYNADLSKVNVNISLDMDRNMKARKKGVCQSSMYPKADKDHAIQHRVQRGDVTGAFDKTIGTCVANLDSNSIDEGLYTLAQSMTCWRGVLTKVYGNNIPR